MGGAAHSRRSPSTLVVHAGPTISTAGKLAAQAWVRARALSAPALTPWHVEISLDGRDGPAPLEFDDSRDTRFRLEIYSEEWGVYFCHHGRASWVRVTDIAFVHGRDDFGLLPIVPPLKDVSSLLRRIERQHDLAFRREHARIRTNVPSAERAVRAWVNAL